MIVWQSLKSVLFEPSRKMEPAVAWSDVIGVPVFDVPVLGYPASFLGTSQGKFVFIVLLIIFTGITVLTDKKMEKTNG